MASMNSYADKGLHCPNPQCTSGPWDNWKSLLLHINNQFSRCKEFRYTLPTTSSLVDATHPVSNAASGESMPTSGRNINKPIPSPRYTENHPNVPRTYGRSKNTLEHMDDDQYATRRLHNVYYPFKDELEWGLARFLCQSSLKQGEIDEFLKLPWVSQLSNQYLIILSMLTPHLHRFRKTTHLSDLITLYDPLWRHYPKLPNGKLPKLLSTVIPPQNRSFSYTAMAWNVSSSSLVTLLLVQVCPTHLSGFLPTKRRLNGSIRSFSSVNWHLAMQISVDLHRRP